MKLEQILRHSLFPFADFRTNDASFRMLELYWATVAREALGEEVSVLVAPLQTADQDKENWGDPLMLDFWIPSQRRGAKVMLAENTGNLPACRDVSVKLNCFPSILVYTSSRGITGPDDEIDQICIRADMSEVARSAVVHFMSAFLVHGVEVDKVESHYYDFCTRTGEGPDRSQLQTYYATLENDDQHRF
ncbi:hypothetical protein [Brucella pituitosa]|uniref:hypothetical protein n=1 Tax=Brucella pituitosa TaxID=571256 RepID=UPI003F4AADBF